jgi:anti-sigma B factor antagonist
MLLRVEAEDREGQTVVTAVGEVDASTADQLGDALLGPLVNDAPRVLLDFEQVTFIDSTGLGVLVKVHREAQARQAAFALVHPTAQTRKLLAVLGLDQLFTVYATLEEALGGGQGRA